MNEHTQSIPEVSVDELMALPTRTDTTGLSVLAYSVDDVYEGLVTIPASSLGSGGGGGGASLPSQTGANGFFLTSNGTTASWAFIPTADAAPTLVAVSATISAASRTVIYTGTGGHTETMISAAANAGKRYTVKNKGSGVWTIDATGLGQLWTNAAVNTLTLAVGDSVELISDGTNWIVS